MKNYLVYLDLPEVPEYLLEPIDVIIKKPPKQGSRISSSYYFFQTRNVQPELSEWVNETFKSNCFAQYQIIRAGLPIHKDIGRNVAFNYLLQPGGDFVTTGIYDDAHNLIDQECIPIKKWHQLKTNEFHCVSGILTDRVALSVEVLSYVWGAELNIS